MVEDLPPYILRKVPTRMRTHGVYVPVVRSRRRGVRGSGERCSGIQYEKE